MAGTSDSGASPIVGRDFVSSPWPDSLFVGPRPSSAVLEHRHGDRIDLEHRRWQARADSVDQALLARSRGPVLDVGCGPGRLVQALVGSGRSALGIDASLAAVSAARRRGAPAVHVSVFDAVPDAGLWGTVLLVDGNIGIGGDASALLRRAGELVVPGGLVLVEVESPTAASADVEVRVESDGRSGCWFRWSRVAAGDVRMLAEASGFVVDDAWHHSGRWFAQLASTVGLDAATMQGVAAS